MAKKKRQGHYCHVCGEHKANEKFSGRGHAAHICKACSKLPAAEKSAQKTVRKIEGMAFRYISKEDMQWLKNRRDHQNEEIRMAARAVFDMKNPNYERNQAKKKLRIVSMEFFLCEEIYDQWGDNYPVNVRFSLDITGRFQRIDYTRNKERDLKLTQNEAVKLLRSLVHELEIPFWEDKRLKPDDEDDYFGDDDEDMDDFDMEDDEEESPEDLGDPMCVLSLEYSDGTFSELKFYDEMDIIGDYNDLYLTLNEYMEGYGDSYSVLFLYGAKCNRFVWDCTYCLPERMITEIVEYPADMLQSAQSVEDIAKWVVENFEDYDYIVGHSMGGLVALAMAAKYGFAGNGIVLVESFLQPSNEYYRNLLMENSDPKMREHLEKTFQKESANYTDALLNSIQSDFDFTRYLQGISVPVYALYGDRGDADYLALMEDLRLPEEVLSRIQVQHIPDCCHMPMLENPEELMDMIFQIIDKG